MKEPSRFVLELPETYHVLHPLLVGLDVAVEEGSVGADTHVVGYVMYLRPFVGIAFARQKELVYPAGKDFGTAAGHGAESRLFQACQGLLGRHLPSAVKVVYLGGGEGLDLNVGVVVMNRPHYLLILLKGPVGVMPSHYMDLPGLRVHVPQNFLHAHLIGVGVSLFLGKIAKGAGEDTDVGGVEVAIQDEEHSIAIALAFYIVGHAPHGREIPGLEEPYPILKGEAFLGQHFLPYRDKVSVHEPDAFYRMHVCDMSLLRLMDAYNLCTGRLLQA